MSRASSLEAQLGERLRNRQWRIASAESCTGGWLAKRITDIAGSSGWFDRGVVSYSDLAKQQMLQVSPATLAAHGAVSEAVVREMALGLRTLAHVDVAVAVTGIAGPNGGTADKPVGTVWFGTAWPDERVHSECRHFHGDREQVRLAAVEHALRILLHRMDHDF